MLPKRANKRWSIIFLKYYKLFICFCFLHTIFLPIVHFEKKKKPNSKFTINEKKIHKKNG